MMDRVIIYIHGQGGNADEFLNEVVEILWHQVKNI